MSAARPGFDGCDGGAGSSPGTPKALHYAAALSRVEGAIVEALPEIVNGLIEQARQGDTKAAAYLIDRILGRTVGARLAPADDRSLPYSEDEFRADREKLAMDREEAEDDRAMRRLLIGHFAPPKRGKSQDVG
jgi:hypothetical protein